MDVVPDRGLVDFIGSRDVEEKKADTSQVLDADKEGKEEETDVWRDIAGALNR